MHGLEVAPKPKGSGRGSGTRVRGVCRPPVVALYGGHGETGRDLDIEREGGHWRRAPRAACGAVTADPLAPYHS